MNKKVAKRVACFAAASLIVFSGTSVIAADGKLSVAEITQNFPAAGLSLGFGNMTAVADLDTAKADEDKDTVKAKENDDKVESNTVMAGVSADVREVVLTSKKAKEDSEFADIAIAQVNDYVNIRSLPSEDGEVLGKLYNNSAATVLEEEGDWYKIKSGNVEGYVKAEFVVRDDPELAEKVRTRIAEVTTETLRVRKEASTDAPIMDLIPEGDTLIVKDESIEGWVGVVVGEKVGYVSTEFVDISSKYVQAESKEEEAARLKAEENAKKKAAADAKAAQAKSAAQAAANNNKQSSNKQSSEKNSSSAASSGGGSGSAVASYALQFVGNPYVYGGSSLTSGTDCSGFVMSVYSAFGVGLPHQSGAQRGCGYGVSVGEAQPGDIMCYSGHVGIYIGNGQMVHASDPSTGIIVSGIGSPIAVRRILG
ncbi:MAG: C40 family peptidase [Lachnospiraceae bacterium]|nr:C40 family peptidase [Lachnospiraceae bacterium]MBR5896158.1 C40 family peptidase [Lachnospiraceae bacterium]